MARTCPGRLYMMMNLPERGTVSWSLMTFQVSGTCTRGKQTSGACEGLYDCPAEGSPV